MQSAANRLVELKAQAAARNREKTRAAYRWRVERIWLGVSFTYVQNAYAADGPFFPLPGGDLDAARQMRRSMLDRNSGCCYRVLVTLPGGEIASCTCTVPRFLHHDPAYMLEEAERVARAEVESTRSKARAHWQD